MKKVIFALSLFILSNTTFADLTFNKLNKCTKTEDRLICSKDHHKPSGFVYFFDKHKLYSLFNGSEISYEEAGPFAALGYNLTIFYEYTCNEMVPSDNAQTPESYTCQKYKEVKHYACNPGRRKGERGTVILHYEDKYGFSQKKNIDADGATFCQDEFKKMLPQ